MINSICPNCNYHNESGLHICRNCGNSLERKAVIMRADDIVVTSRQLPSRQLKRLGASLIVSAAALLLEIGFIYARRRLRYVQVSDLVPSRKRKLPATVETQIIKPVTTGKRLVSVYSERVIEERRWGRMVRRIVDRAAWRSEETIES